jgi:hypothetical protein
MPSCWAASWTLNGGLHSGAAGCMLSVAPEAVPAYRAESFVKGDFDYDVGL